MFHLAAVAWLASVAARAFVPPAGAGHRLGAALSSLVTLLPLHLAFTVPWGCVRSGENPAALGTEPGFVGTLVRALGRGNRGAGLRAPGRPENS